LRKADLEIRDKSDQRENTRGEGLGVHQNVVTPQE